MSSKFRPIPTRTKVFTAKRQSKQAPRALYLIEAGLLGMVFMGYIGMQIAQRFH